MSRENGFHGFFGLDDKDGISEQFFAPDGLEGSGFDSSGERRYEFERAYGKRIKMTGPNQQNVTPLNLSEDFTPLGLTLRKTPSFLDLIEMKLSQPTGAFPVEPSRSIDSQMTRLRCNDSNSQPIAEKLKASNFPVSLLKIGSWERICHYEGDLVAKCYFAKRKLVWEVLHSGLKNKIEFQWSDISAIRASYSDNARGILEIELNNPPNFFRETTPQPRKHTLWQATSDFTGGQASIYRRHYLQFPEGTLQKHYEKLLQCDGRLHLLSQKPFPTLSSPYFSFFGGSQGLSYEPSIQVPRFTTGFDLNFKDSSVQFPRYSIGRSAPTQQISNFELLRPTINNNAFNSPCTVPDFPHIERLDVKEQEQHGIPFWDGIDNQEVIGNTSETQLPETSSICSANQIASFLSREMSSSCLLSSNTPNLLSSKNWELNKIAEQLLNEPSACTSSNEQMILRRLNSIQTLPSSAEMNLGVDNLGILHEDQDLEKSSDDSVISKSPFSTDDDGGYPYSNFMSRLPVQSQPENFLNHPPQNAPFPYWFTDQSAEDFVNEPKTEWNKWR